MDDSEVSLRDDMTLDYVIRVDDVPPTGRDAAFELPAEMRAAMTQRFGVKNLDALKKVSDINVSIIKTYEAFCKK